MDNVSVSDATSQKFIYFHQPDHADRACPQHSIVALLYDRCNAGNLAALITIPIQWDFKVYHGDYSIVSHLASIHNYADCMHADHIISMD